MPRGGLSATLIGMQASWTPGSWRALPADQQPEWPDGHALEQVHKTLSSLPPLVFAGEARSLKASLADVAAGEAFLLQAGDCAESFHDFTADSIRDKLKVILQMAVVLTYGAGVPVVKLGRIAGQFAKPRSSPTEVVDGQILPSFRGHVVNDDAPTQRHASPTPPACSPRTTSPHRPSICCGRSPREVSPTCLRCTRGTSSSSLTARAAATTTPWPGRSTGPCDSCGRAGSTSAAARCTRWTSGPATRLSSWASRRP